VHISTNKAMMVVDGESQSRSCSRAQGMTWCRASRKAIICYFSIDATNDNNLARYVNDAPRKFANCTRQTLMISGCLHVCLFAVKDIRAGCELCYDYVGGNMPWREVFCFQYS